MAQDGSPAYTVRNAARGVNARVYEAFISALQLSPTDRAALTQRGLTQEQIQRAGYVTKPTNNIAMLQHALGIVSHTFDASENVPGFFKDKHDNLTCLNMAGLLIPMRDINGAVSALQLRPDKPLRANAKYMTFATPKKYGGRGVRVQTHVPMIGREIKRELAQTIGTTVRLTEGILKADVATALDPEHFCIGLPGLNAPEDLPYVLNELGISTVLIAFDQESSNDVLLRRAKLYNALRDDYEVHIEQWDPAHKGIDDALLKSPGSIHRAEGDELNKILSTAGQIDPVNNNYIYVISVERFIEQDTFEELSKAQYADTFHLGTPKNVNDILAVSGPGEFPRVKGLTFWPASEKIVEEDFGSAFNLWRAPGIVAAPGNINPFLEHMEYIVPEQRERHILLQWMAHQIQLPGEKIHWSALIQGQIGIGKSLIGRALGKLIGEDNVARPTNEEFNEIYTSWQRNCQLVIVEEIKANHRMDLMNKLKPKITDPICTVREMHKNSYKQPNRYNLLFFTNHKDALIIDEHERRYFIIYSPAVPRESTYYNFLADWLTQESSLSALAHYLGEYSLADFEAKAHAPKTAARAELVELSRSPLEDYIHEGIENSTWPFQMDLVSLHHLRTSNHVPTRLRDYSPNKWAEALLKCGAVKWQEGRKILLNEGHHKLWIIRRVELWGQAGAELVREHFDKWRGASAPGANPLDEVHPL